jgi:hypothetical protein
MVPRGRTWTNESLKILRDPMWFGGLMMVPRSRTLTDEKSLAFRGLWWI